MFMSRGVVRSKEPRIYKSKCQTFEPRSSILCSFQYHNKVADKIEVTHFLSIESLSQRVPIVDYHGSGQFNRQLVSQLVGALSPVSYKGLHQGWTQTSLYLQVVNFTSHHSHVFWAYLYSAGIQHGNLPPAGWPILFCGASCTCLWAALWTDLKPCVGTWFFCVSLSSAIQF